MTVAVGPSRVEDAGFQARIRSLESLLQDIEGQADAGLRAKARDVVQALLDLHGAGLARVLDCLARAGEAGKGVLSSLVSDDLVGSLLLLHGLHPVDLEARVRQALDRVRPYLGSHGGDVELLGITGEGMVRLRLKGSCNGCGSSRSTIEHSIEEAVYGAAPDVQAIDVEGAADERPAGAVFVPVSQLIEDTIVASKRDGKE